MRAPKDEVCEAIRQLGGNSPRVRPLERKVGDGRLAEGRCVSND